MGQLNEPTYKVHVLMSETARDRWQTACAEEGCSLSALLSVIDPGEHLPQEVFQKARAEAYRRRSSAVITRRQMVAESKRALERRQRNRGKDPK